MLGLIAQRTLGSTNAPGDDFTVLNLTELMQVEVPTVYGASKHDQKITEAPSAVTIVTAEDIKLHGYRTLADILRNVRGFYVTSDRAYSFIGVRGVNRPGDFGGRILIMVDGHRMNDPIYDSALSDTSEFLDVDLIERVEIIRGPGSSLYGNNAVFAVINLITRKGRTVNQGEMSGSAGSWDTYNGRFTVGHSFTNGAEFLASASFHDSAGHKHLYFPEYKNSNGGFADNLDHDQGDNFFTSLSYGGLSLSGGYSERKKQVPSASFGVVFDGQPSLYDDQRGFAELKYVTSLAEDWDVLGRLFYDVYRYTGYYLFDYGGVGNPKDYVENRDISLSQFVGGEVQVTKRFWEKHRLTFGGEFRNDLSLDLKNFDVVSGTTYLNTHNNADNFGLYSQGEFVLAKPLTLNAGVRYDHYRSFGDTVNPRAGLIYSPFKETAIKALYGQAFRAPNAFETGYISPAYDRNPNLKPETVKSFDLVWEQGFARNYRTTTTLFYENISDLITKQINTVTGHSIFENTDSAKSLGADFEVEAQWKGGWRGKVSYTYAHATGGASGGWLSNSPEHMGKLSLSAPLYQEKVFATLEVQAMSDRLTVANTKVGAFAVCNFTLFSQELIKNFEFSASVYNLFDTHYSDPVSVDYLQKSIQQDGRSFRAKLTWKF